MGEGDEETDQAAAAAADKEELPENWRVSVDKEEGRVYYWNVITREVSWFRPVSKQLASKSPGVAGAAAGSTTLASMLASSRRKRGLEDESDPRRAAARRRMALLQTTIGAEEEAQSADDAEQRAKSRVHVGSDEFRHLRGYDMNSLAARVVVTGVKRS